MPLPALHSQPVPAAAKTAPAPELSLRGGRRPTWRPEREARGSALGVQSREGTAVPYRPPLKWQTPKYGVQRRSLRSRWRLCRLTDAASPLRGLSAIGSCKYGGIPGERAMPPSLSFRGAKRRGNLLQPVAFSLGGACPSPTRRLRSAKYPKNRSCPRGVEDVAPYKAPPILHKKLRDPCGPRRRFILPCRPARAAFFSAGRKTGHTR